MIPRNLQDAFIEKVQGYLKTFYGDNVKASADYPRIVNNKHFDRLNALIIDHKIAVGGEKNRDENYLAPTLLKDVDFSDKVMEDEIFGPILPLIPYDRLEDAIKSILQYPKPLAFYVFSEDPQKQKDIISPHSFWRWMCERHGHSSGESEFTIWWSRDIRNWELSRAEEFRHLHSL